MDTTTLAPSDDPVPALLALGLDGAARAGTISETIREDRHTWRAWSARPAMGTLVSIVALDASRERTEDALEKAFAEMARLVAILSRHDENTPVAELNGRGRIADAPPELLELVQRARRLHWITRGVFDVTVKPLVDLFRAARGEPPPLECVEAAELVGIDRLRVSGRTLSFERAGMGLTLDGIAKGYVVDRMADALLARGVRHFLINAGGDVRAGGGKQDGRPWTVGVRDPLRPDEILEIVPLVDGALATSGNYERASAHLFDARSADAPRSSTSASVTAPNATAADALATTLFVLGGTQGGALMELLSRCAGMIVDRHGRALRSQRWRSGTPKRVEHES